MYFQVKNTLKNNNYNTLKHPSKMFPFFFLLKSLNLLLFFSTFPFVLLFLGGRCWIAITLLFSKAYSLFLMFFFIYILFRSFTSF